MNPTRSARVMPTVGPLGPPQMASSVYMEIQQDDI
jgi:hypothetical protein